MKKLLISTIFIMSFYFVSVSAQNYCGIKIHSETNFNTMRICGLTMTCLDNDFIELKISAYLPVSGANPENAIKYLNNKEIYLVVDSVKIGNPSSKNCYDSKRIDKIVTGLVVDNSGSMVEPVGSGDNQQRMAASKNAINNFIDILKPEDKAFVMSFSSFVELVQDITKDKSKLRNGVNSLFPTYATQMHGAVLQALQKLNSSKEGIKALVVLTDGLNNITPMWGPAFAHRLASMLHGTKLFFIALSMGNSEYEIKARDNMKTMANLSGGAFFDIYDSYKLDLVYKSLRKEIKSDECCELSFKLKAKEIGTKRNYTLLVNNENITWFASDYFTDICKDWANYAPDEGCIRVRYAVALDDNSFFKYKTELLQNGEDLYLIPSPFPLMDVVSYRTFGTIEEAEMYIEEFNELRRIFPEKYLLKYTPEVYLCNQDEDKW